MTLGRAGRAEGAPRGRGGSRPENTHPTPSLLRGRVLGLPGPRVLLRGAEDDSRATREVQQAPVKERPETLSQEEGAAGRTAGGGGPGDGDSEATRGAQWGEEEEGFHRVCSVAGDAIAPCVKSRPQRHFSRLRDQRRAPRLQRADGGTEKVLAQPGRSRSIRDQRAPGWGRWSPERECWGLSRLLGRDPPPPEPAARTVEFRPVPARPGTTGPSRTAN